MAKKQALRDLQARLAERLQQARTTQRSAWLAVEAGGHGFLLPLKEAGEIFAPAPVLPVPHTHRWFLGVANLRGHLHGVVDLAGFLGLKRAEAGLPGVPQPSQLVGFNATLELNCVLMVDRLAGLRGEDQLTRETDDGGPRPAFAGGRWRDAAGRAWQELSLAALAGDEAFLRIVG